MESTLLPHEPGDVLELGEIWTFVGSKADRVWIWIALCHQLWHKVPAEYQGCFCYADDWDTYVKVIPEHQLHQQQKKGPTNHLERFNLTLRQRLPRLIRKTLSFSKSLKMHIICLRRFFMCYNLEQAARYLQSIPT